MAMIAIVAIPRADDYVWQISSEKVPHLTLCVLGDSLDNEKQVEDFLAHAADTSLRPFTLEVERRGLLGDKSADVLFFRGSGVKMVEDFRKYLLGNDDIRKAYDAVEQYPEWTPHLTLGYPETPAKPDKRDYPGIGWVGFDRIALWTGDYEGVEFPLKIDDNAALSMSAKGEAFLEHFGVKGMNRGVVHDRAKGAHAAYKKATTSADAQASHKVRTKAKVVGVNALTNKELQTVITRMNLEQQYVHLKRVEHDQSLVGMGKKWVGNFVTDVLKDVATSWLRNPFAKEHKRKPDRYQAQAWANGQQFASVIEGTATPRAIGR